MSKAESRISLIQPEPAHQEAFLASAQSSKELHTPWTTPPLAAKEYQTYLGRIAQDNQAGFLVCLSGTENIVGVINLNEIVRGAFQSAYLGYYAFQGYEGQGLMREGMQLLIGHAFNNMKLHRLEANVQAENTSSIALVEACGFIKEGFSKHYLNINGHWKDHLRYAITTEAYAQILT